MNTFTATVFIETNPLSQEKLACGLLAVTPNKLFFDWAMSKVKLAESLADKEYKGYFVDRLRTIERSLKQEDNARNRTTNGLFDGMLSRSHFERLEQYNAGPVQFGDIKPYGDTLDAKVFAKLYKETVQQRTGMHKRSSSGVYRAVNIKLERPTIQAKADVQYELPQQHIQGLIYDARISMITVNGSIQALQAVNMNSSLGTVTKNLNEMEMIYHQLVKFGKTRNTPVDKVQLVYEPAANGQESELVDKVRTEKQDVFDLLTLSDLDAQLDQIEKNPAYRRFSEFIEE